MCLHPRAPSSPARHDTSPAIPSPVEGQSGWIWCPLDALHFHVMVEQLESEVDERHAARTKIHLRYMDDNRPGCVLLGDLWHVDSCEAAKREYGVAQARGIMYRAVDGTEHSSLRNEVLTWCDQEPDAPATLTSFQYGWPTVAPEPAADHALQLASVPTMVELYAGTGELSRAFHANHKFCVTLHDRHTEIIRFDDQMPRAAVRLVQKELLEIGDADFPVAPDVLHASPDCTTFSSMAKSVHRRYEQNHFLGITPEASASNESLEFLLCTLIPRLLHRNPRMLFLIENPEGDMHQMAVVKEFLEKPRADGGLGAQRVAVSYCKFAGRDVQKNTHLWTNCQQLIDRFRDSLCNEHQPCVDRMRFGKHTRNVRDKSSSVEAAAFPRQFAESAAQCLAMEVAKMRQQQRTPRAKHTRWSKRKGELTAAGFRYKLKPGEGDQSCTKHKVYVWEDPDRRGEWISEKSAFKKLKQGSATSSPSSVDNDCMPVRSADASEDDEDESMFRSRFPGRYVVASDSSDAETGDDAEAPTMECAVETRLIDQEDEQRKLAKRSAAAARELRLEAEALRAQALQKDHAAGERLQESARSDEIAERLQHERDRQERELNEEVQAKKAHSKELYKKRKRAEDEAEVSRLREELRQKEAQLQAAE